ncbi:MAG TPA: YdcF family protein [Alphaproteobacteria bacterium]
MFFLLSKILMFFLAPLNVAIFLICAAMVCLYLGRRKYAQWAGMACCAVLVVFAVLPTGPVLMKFLETRYVAPDPLPRRVDGIILLGGVLDSDIGMSHGVPQMDATADRLIAFANLAYRYPYARLVYSSGLGNLSQTGTPEGAMAVDALETIGFRAGRRLVVEDQARTTYENAKLSKELVHPQPGQTWLIVTSAWHMPRAMGVFAAADWPVVPVPTDWRTGGKTGGGFLYNLTMSHLAIKELGGIVLYAVTGKWASPATPQPAI